jgi:hypothetical protein
MADGDDNPLVERAKFFREHMTTVLNLATGALVLSVTFLQDQAGHLQGMCWVVPQFEIRDLFELCSREYSGRTKRPLGMGYGWRNLEGAANNYLEPQWPLASKAGYMGCAALPQTSGM